MRPLLVIFLTLSLPLFPFTLQEKLRHGEAGDYIVTQQEKNLSLLLIRSLTDNTIVLEEITAPLSRINIDKTKWNEWLQKQAPGHTSWNAYEIDLKEGKLLDAFSYLHRGWLYRAESQHIFSRLLALPLASLPQNEWRRIGPPPQAGESDTRALWIPPLTIQGKKIDKRSFEAWQTHWPKDDSELAGCAIELYFDQVRPTFPFPVWVEFKSTHYALKLRAIDSGTSIISPQPLMPHRSPEFIGTPIQRDGNLVLTARASRTYPNYQLSAIDVSSHSSIPLPFQLSQEKDLLIFTLQSNQLKNLLIKEHRYIFTLTVDGVADVYSETDLPFIWN